MEDIVYLGKCFETLYQTLDIMIEEYSKMDDFNDIVHKLQKNKSLDWYNENKDCYGCRYYKN